MADLSPFAAKSDIKGSVHTPWLHDSAKKHVAGNATYIDDIVEPAGLLNIYVAMSPKAHARIRSMDLSQVRSSPGVALVLTADDIPGKNDASPHAGDDPVFAESKVEYAGQSLFAVAADTIEQARCAAEKAIVAYEDLAPIITIAEARNAKSFIEPAQVMRQGDSVKALAAAPMRRKGRITVGGQDHFYLEGQIALALPQEDRDVHVYSSTQHPSEVQHIIARVLDVPNNAVTVELRRMGGAFGGKESQPGLIAAIASLVATKTGRPAKLRLDRDADMIMTGKRHEFEIDYDVGFDDAGLIQGLELTFASRCGYSTDLSPAVNDRAMFHADNAYFLSDVTITSHRCKTNTVSNTAFRGFGGPQGMMGIERIMDVIAHALGKEPLDVRKRNLYGKTSRNTTPYHQTVTDNVADEIIAELETSAAYRKRRAAVQAFNDKNEYQKKGIALTPMKFGISFTAKHLNQAGALIHIYSDGSVHLNHGGTEMGQGLFVKIAQVVAEEFQIDIDKIKVTSTTTGKVPNTSATAASSGSDLNGMAAQAAAQTIKARLTKFAAAHFGTAEEHIQFRDNNIYIGNETLSFDELANLAYMNRVSLSATGFYKTPDIHYDRATHQGRPFYYFAYGAAVAEVIVDMLTGENKVVRADLLLDAGKSLNPAMDYGQIEGGFVQGMGWLTTEEVVIDDKGHLQTHAPSTYKIPTASDRPGIFNMEIWKGGENREATIYRSKAVGEPPLMLAISVFSALTDAVASVAAHKVMPTLHAPATPEALLMAIDDVRRRAEQGEA